MKKTTVNIAGGGFAGLSVAMYFDKTLARREDVEVTLISRENFILFTPMLHEVAAGDLTIRVGEPAAQPISRLSGFFCARHWHRRSTITKE
jgi:NADH dehydrogenase FAD-containing subunit